MSGGPAPRVPDAAGLLRAEREAAARDPLGLDDVMTDGLPALNAAGDTAAIEGLTRRALARLADSGPLDAVSARAALRDLGMLAGSFVRHRGTLPALPGLDTALRTLGRAADEVPRDTLYSYTTRNPADRLRTFTGDDGERLFISVLRDSAVALLRAIELVAGVCAHGLDAPGAADRLERAGAELEVLSGGIRDMRGAMTPQHFTGVLRPYFEPFPVAGVTRHAPNGSQLPLVALEVFLYGPRPDLWQLPLDPGYDEENLGCLPPALRRACATVTAEHALVARFLGDAASRPGSARKPAAADGPGAADGSARTAEALRGLVSVLLRFRRGHFHLAADNMRIRPPGSVGSGGYDLEILGLLGGRTEAVAERLPRNRG